MTHAHELGPPPVEVRGLVKRYGELTAVAGVDLTVRAGDVYGYLGPNGAGKTTSLRMMLGLIRPTEATLFRASRVLTMDWTARSARGWAWGLGTTRQRPNPTG